MIKITPDLIGIKRLIAKVSKASTDMSPATIKLAGIMHNAVEENFEKGGRPSWIPLKPATLKQKKGRGGILRHTGRLASSIFARHDATSAEVGTNVKVREHLLGAIHQFGARAGRKGRSKIPARPFLKLTKKDINDMQGVIKKFLDNL